MNDSDLCWMSAFDLAAAIAKKKVSPVEVVDATLARIDKLKELNAYVTLDADGARKAAKAAERAVGQRGVKLGPLHGVPFSVKDLIITKGIRTTFGTPLYRDNVPAEDAPSVARMKAAGAIMLGKTNTPTLGWVGVTDNLLFGVTRNPWSPSHTPGGSSGGAGAAVAAGLAPLAIGTDGGGSIRKPAAWCGIFGLKASWGRIPVYPHGAAWSLSHAGPMTRTVKGAARVPRARLPRRERRAEMAVALRLLADDLPGRDRSAAGALSRSARPDRPRPAADRRRGDEVSADEVRRGVVRAPRLVAAGARLLRALRSAAHADRRLPAAPHRRVLRDEDRGRARRTRGRERLHVHLQHDGPAGSDG